ncbi:DUF6151 family protein [Paracoccaceae bacterium]
MTPLTCACGQSRLFLTGPPILAADCCCESCAEAAARLQALPGVPQITNAVGATPFVLYRKDRVVFELPRPLRSFRLSGGAKTRRLLAPCCNTPIGLEFSGGHWISLYSSLWPPGTAPKARLRTMTSDWADRASLPQDLPNAGSQSPGFMWALLKAWIAMGFRAPKLATEGEVDA